MQVIPAINCKDFKSVKQRILAGRGFLPKNAWLQIDVSDGKFTKAKSWNNPRALFGWMKKDKINFRIEVHLMVEDVEKELGRWFAAGAGRAIVHIEALEQPGRIFKKYGRKVGLAIKPQTPVEELSLYVLRVNFFQILAVSPGYSGQKFSQDALKKIKHLRKIHPKAVIEVDGGINEKTAKLAKKAGADIAASGSFVWDSKDTAEAYRKLRGI